MVTLTRAELQGRYSWSAIGDDNPRLTGEPDSVLLNRHEGYEVLAFINSFLVRHTFNPPPATRLHGLKVEQMIAGVPGHLRSRQHVDEWIVANWGSH